MQKSDSGQSRLPLLLMVVGGVLLVLAGIWAFTGRDSGGDDVEEDAEAVRCAFPACRAAATQALARGFEGQSVAVNPRDPDHIVVTDANMTTAHCTWHVTFNRGKDWTDGIFEVPAGYTGCHINGGSGGHVPTGPGGVAFGPSGAVYATFGSALFEDGPRESILLGKSTDGGKSFKMSVVARPFEDEVGYARPQMSVAPGPGGSDRVLISFWRCRERLFCDQALFSRSDDNGVTFIPPVTINDAPAGQTPSEPVQGPDGTVFITFIRRYTDGPADLVLARSSDSGATFGYTLIDRQIAIGDQYDQAKLALDPRRGTMYITYTDARIGRQQVFFRTSTDKGATWSEAIGISADRAASGAARSPTISVAPNGRIDIAFYRSLQADSDDVFWAHSIDGGRRFVPRQVNEGTIKRFQYAAAIGNWYPPDVASADDAAIIVWSDTKNTDQISNTQDVFLRRMVLTGPDAPP